MRKLLLFITIFMSTALYAVGTIVHDGFIYIITSPTDFQVEAHSYVGEYGKDIIVPATFDYNGRTFHVKGIGRHCFNANAEGARIVISEGIEYFNSFVFPERFYKSITIPSTLKTIYGLQQGSRCDTVYIADLNAYFNIESNEDCPLFSFSQICVGNKLLTELTVPDGVSCVKNRFKGWLSLESITIPSCVKQINEEAFTCCKNLKTITFNTIYCKIGRHAFSFCDNIKTIFLPTIPPDINAESFTDKQKAFIDFIVPKGSLDAYKYHPEWSKMSVIKEQE